MNAPGTTSRGTVCTFYSFKGGVGRSMALANVAVLLARWGQRVLVIDWDLEAPGIEKFFQHWLVGDRRNQPGLVELVQSAASANVLDWRSCTLSVTPPQAQKIMLLHAGRDDQRYAERLRDIDWERLFDEHRFGLFLESLRKDWIAEFDFVLIDARTGITDIGGICSIFLPDVLLTFFTATEQSLVGVKDVMVRARGSHAKLPVDRRRLLVVPIPSRDESNSEYKLAAEWRKRFASELQEFFSDWIPKEETPERVLNHLKIPYFAYWSFGERLPALEEDPDNPKTLAFSYQLIARLLLGKLDWEEVRKGTRAAEAKATQQLQVEEKRQETVLIRATAQRQAEERRRAEEIERTKVREERLGRFVGDRFMPVLYGTQRSIRRLWGAIGISGGLGLAGTAMNTFFVPSYDLSNPFRQVLVVASILSLTGASYCWFLMRRYVQLGKWLAAERALFDGLASPYADTEPDGAFKRFVERVESIIESGRRIPLSAAKATGPDVTAKSSGGPATETPHPDDKVARKLAVEAMAPPATSTLPHVEGTGADAASRGTPDSYDVFVSYRTSRLVDGWLGEFLPLLGAWLEETWGRKARIFYDKQLPEGSDARVSLADELTKAVCFVPILTPAYFASELCLQEWRAFAARAPDAIFPVVLHRGDFPDFARNVQWMDLADFAYLGEGFSRTDRYVEFQDRVREFATALAQKAAVADRATIASL